MCSILGCRCRQIYIAHRLNLADTVAKALGQGRLPVGRHLAALGQVAGHLRRHPAGHLARPCHAIDFLHQSTAAFLVIRQVERMQITQPPAEPPRDQHEYRVRALHQLNMCAVLPWPVRQQLAQQRGLDAVDQIASLLEINQALLHGITGGDHHEDGLCPLLVSRAGHRFGGPNRLSHRKG